MQASPQSMRKSVSGGKKEVSALSVRLVSAPLPTIVALSGSVGLFDIMCI